MLLIENGNESHYVWIKDFNKLMDSQSKNGQRFMLLLFATFHIRKHSENSC